MSCAYPHMPASHSCQYHCSRHAETKAWLPVSAQIPEAVDCEQVIVFAFCVPVPSPYRVTGTAQQPCALTVLWAMVQAALLWLHEVELKVVATSVLVWSLGERTLFQAPLFFAGCLQTSVQAAIGFLLLLGWRLFSASRSLLVL